MTDLPPIAVFSLLCTIALITGGDSSNHGLQTPRCIASDAPWWENISKSPIVTLNQNKEETKIPELSCISTNPSIYDIFQEIKDHCKGEDYKVMFYYQKDREYIELGALVIDKYLFDNVLKKYSDWSLHNQKIRPINEVDNSKVNKGTCDNNKLSDKELNKVIRSLERDPCEDNLADNIVKEREPTFIICDDNNPEHVDDDTNYNTHKKGNQDTCEDKECCKNRNDKKYTNYKTKFNPKYNYFEVTLPENVDTTSSPTIINVQIDGINKKKAKNCKKNKYCNKGRLYGQDKDIPLENQNLLLGDDVSDLKFSDIVDLLLNYGYEVKLNTPVEFNLENSQDIDTIQTDLMCPNAKEEQPFYISTVTSDNDSNDYIVDQSEGIHNDLPKDDDLKSIAINDPNTCSPYKKKPFKESKVEPKSPKNTGFIIDAYPDSKPSESIISTQTSPLNKESEPSPSFYAETDSISPNSVVVEPTPSIATETLPINKNEPTESDSTLTYLSESKPSIIPLTLHELLPLTSISPSLLQIHSISDSPPPEDISHLSLSPLNCKTLNAVNKLKGNLPVYAKNELGNQKYVQPIEVPLTPVSSIINLPSTFPTPYNSVPTMSPSLIVPKTAKIVIQPSMAADSNLNIRGYLSKPPPVSQMPVTISKPLISTPFELSEKCVRQFLQLPEMVTVSLSSPDHTNSPSDIFLSKIPQVTEASSSTTTAPLIYEDMTPIQDVTTSNDSPATTPKKDYTKVLYSQQPTVGNYVQQKYPIIKQIPVLKNTVPNVMTTPKKTNDYFIPNINPYFSTLIPTRDATASQISNTINPIFPVDKHIYFTKTPLAPKSKSIPKEICPLPYNISELPVSSYASPLSYSSTPLSNYWNTISASPVTPVKGIFQPAVVSDGTNMFSSLPSNFIDPMQSYVTPLIDKFKTQPLLPCPPKSEEILKPIYETSSAPSLDTTCPNTISFITPMNTEQMLKQIPTTSSIEPLAKPSSVLNKYNSYTSPCKSNVQYLSTFATPVISLPLTAKPIEAIPETTTLLTVKPTPISPVIQTTPIQEIPVLSSEVVAIPSSGKEICNLKPVPLNHIATTPSIPLWSNKIPMTPLLTKFPPSNSIFQGNYVMPNVKEFNTETTSTSPVSTVPYTSPIFNANVQNISPLFSDSLITCKKLPKYVFQPKSPDDILISPVSDYAAPILSPLNSLTLSPIKSPYSKPLILTSLTTPLLGKVFYPKSSYTFQPHPPPSNVSPLYSKETPIHNLSSNFVTPLTCHVSPIYEDIPQNWPLKIPKQEIFSSGSPLHFAKSSLAASSTPLSLGSHYSPLLAEKIMSQIPPCVPPLSIEKIQSIPVSITPKVPSVAYTSPLMGTIMKKPTLSSPTTLQKEHICDPMLSESTPLLVNHTPIPNKPLQGKISQWKPLDYLSVNYTPDSKERIQNMPLNHLTLMPSNAQFLSKQHAPLQPYKYETLSSPQFVSSLPKSATIWSKPYGLSQYSEKYIPILHTDYPHSVLSPVSLPDFSSNFKLLPLTHAEPLSTRLNSFNLKTYPLNPICSDIKSPPMRNQIIPNTPSTPVTNLSPIETVTQILPLEINNVNYTPLAKHKSFPEPLTSLPQTVTANEIYKKVPLIISPLQPAEPQISPIKALFYSNLQRQLPHKDVINRIQYSSQFMSPSILPVSELKDIAPVASQTIPFTGPITPCKWLPKANAPTISEMTPCTHKSLAHPYSNIAEPITGTPLSGVSSPLSEISIDISTVNKNKAPLFTSTRPQLQTLPVDSSSTSTSLLSKYELPVFSPELKPIESVLPVKEKLSLKAFSPLSPPLASPCLYKPSSSFLTPVSMKYTYPLKTRSHLITPLKYQLALESSSLPTASLSHTSIQPLFTPGSNQIPSKTPLYLSPYDYAALDIAKEIAPIVPVSLPINSKTNPLQYTAWTSGSLIPISPLSESQYVEYTPAPSTPMNPFGKSSPLIDSAPILVSPLQPPVLETNLVVPPFPTINSLLNLKRQNLLYPLTNIPLKPLTIFSPTHVSSSANLNTIEPTVPFPITQSLQPISPCNTFLPKTSTFVPVASTVKPSLLKTTPITSIQPLFTSELSVPSAASVTAAFKSLNKPHNIRPGTILSPQRLKTPIITPFDSTIPPENSKLTSASYINSILPVTMQGSPILTSSLHNTLLPSAMMSLVSTPVNTVSNTNIQYDSVPRPEPIRFSTPSLVPVHPLPLKYTKFTPKMSPYWSFTPCSSIKNAPFGVINPSPLSKPINIPCPVNSETVSAPTMTPQSLPLLPTHSTFTSTPISFAPQLSSSMPKRFLPLTTVSPSITSVQQPYSFAEYITPKVAPALTKISPISSTPAISSTFPSKFDSLIPVPLQVNPISAKSKLTNAEYISPLPIVSPINHALRSKTLSTTPNYLLNPFSIMKPELSRPLSNTCGESPITFHIQTPCKQYSTPLFTSLPLKPFGLTVPYTRPSLYTSLDPKTVSPINTAIDKSNLTPTTPTYITPLSGPNSKITSNLHLTPLELSQYMATKLATLNNLTSKQNFFASPSKIMNPCYGSQRLSYLSPSQIPYFTPNYISNFATNTLPITKKPVNSNPYSNAILNSVKDFSPVVNAKVLPCTSTPYKSIQPLLLPTTECTVNPVCKSTTIPIKSIPALPLTELPQSSIPYTLSSPTPFVIPLSIPISSSLNPSPSQKPISNLCKTLTTPLKPILQNFVPSQHVSSLPSVAFQESIQPLRTNIGTPASSSTQFSPSKTTPYSTHFSSKVNLVTPAEFIEPSNVQKQPLAYKLISNTDNLAEYYHNPLYTISTFNNDNTYKPVHNINNEKSPSKTTLYPNSYSKPLTTVPTLKVLPVNPITQPTPIDTRYIDDSMFKIYPLPSNYISGAPNLETLKYESYDNNLKSSIPVTNNNIAPLELQNYINNIKNIKYDRTSKADISIPLGKFVLPKKEITNQITHNITPAIGLKMWPSNITIVEAKLQLKFKDITVNNFQPVVKEIDPYDANEIQKLVKNYIRNKYGDVIVVPNNYSLNGQYDVIKDCSNNCDNRCNLLWPADTSSQWSNQKGIL